MPQNFAIRSKTFRIILKTIPIFLVNPNHTKETIVSKYPPIMQIPSSGIATIFEIKNVNDIVLKFLTITGNIVICAAIGTLIIFIIFCIP